MQGWLFGDLDPFAYDLIMADPPWRFANWSKAGEAKNPMAHYDCAPLEWIERLPVGHLAKGDCILWLWATNPMLPQALHVMSRWGFTFKTAGHWAKWNSKTEKLAFGPGYLLRSAGEPFLIGTIGSLPVSTTVRSVIMGARREHSRKPDEAYIAAEALWPDARRADLFSRETRHGWEGWGLEAGKFDLEGE